MMNMGWTWDEARKLPYHVYLKLKRYWSEVAPPLPLAMAALAGFKPAQPAGAAQTATAEEIFGAFRLDPSKPQRRVKQETQVMTF